MSRLLSSASAGWQRESGRSRQISARIKPSITPPLLDSAAARPNDLAAVAGWRRHRRGAVRNFLLGLALIGLGCGSAFAQAQTAGNGWFTADQAERGHVVYATTC